MPFVLQKEAYYHGMYDDVAGFMSYDEALAECCRQFDSGNDFDDWRIVEQRNGAVYPVPNYKLHKEPCTNCGKEVRMMDLVRTRDCHGIPFRAVCPDCYDRLMSKGYDGEYYTEADENIDEDY